MNYLDNDDIDIELGMVIDDELNIKQLKEQILKKSSKITKSSLV